MIKGPAAHQAKIAGVGSNIHVDHLAQQPIKHRRRSEFEPAFSLSFQALAIDDIIALIHLGHHLADKFRGILQIGIENKNSLATTNIQACAERNLVAIIAGKIDCDEVRVCCGQIEDRLAGAVCRTIDDEDNLVGLANLLLTRRGYASIELIDAVHFIVARDDGRERNILWLI